MSQLQSPDVVVYVCANCLPQASTLPRQWKQHDAHVLVRQMPCSGKVDVQYLLHAIEGGARGFCIVTCPKGECHLAQGNYRAEVRVGTVQRLLREIDVEEQRVVLLHCSPRDPAQQVKQLIQDAVAGLCGLAPIDDRSEKTLT